MIRHLHVENVALLERATLEFEGGMTVLTGETGAGKSLLLDALSLLAGARSSPSLVRTGADRATVEALFEVAPGGAAARWLEEQGLECAEAGEVILRREVFASGRGRASINGRLVPVTQLAAVAEHLIDIGAQHEQHALLEGAAQRDLYDAFAGAGAHRARVGALYHALQEREAERADQFRRVQEREQRRDFLAFQVAEIEEAGLRPGELAELEEEARRLSHVGTLVAGGARVAALLSESEGDGPAALDAVGAAIALLEDLAEIDAALAPALEALREAQSRLSDAGYEISRHLGRLEEDPARVDEVIARAEALRRLLRKHGPTEEDALVALDSMRGELDLIENWDREQARLDAEIGRLRADLGTAAAELGSLREKARRKFLRPLGAMLRDFALPAVQLEMEFRPVRSGVDLGGGVLCGPAGAEEVQILFSANAGEEPQPLRRVASGGELSRVMLALRTMEAEKGERPFMVFDEIDAGISGTAARKVAERMAALSKRCQLLCVTHNPSIASAADHHLVVEKREEKGRTFSRVEAVLGLRREEELARLLDGGKRSEKGRALAAELLERAG